MSLIRGRILGKNRNVGKYLIGDELGNTYDMIYFGDLKKLDAFLEEKYGTAIREELYGRGLYNKEALISMAYYPDINYYAGRESVQIVMQHYC